MDAENSNFNITEWVDRFFSFTHKKHLQDEKASSESGAAFTLMKAGIINLENAQFEGAPLEEDFLYKVASKLAPVLGLRCTKGFLLVISSYSQSPGEVVMWMMAFRHEQDGNDVDPNDPLIVDANYFYEVTNCKMPTRDHLSSMWDAQKNRTNEKIGSDNWLDYLKSEAMFIDATRKGYVEIKKECVQ